MKRITIPTIVLLFVLSTIARSTTYFYPASSGSPTPVPGAHFVSTSGNDLDTGLIGHPWKTIAKVMTKLPTFAPGDYIYFRCGDSWAEQFTLANVNGAPGNPIVFDHYGACTDVTNTSTDYIPGNVVLPKIDGSSTRQFGFVANASNVSYVTLNGFEIHDVTGSAINFRTSGGAMPGITISHMLLHQNGPGACAGCGTPFDDGNYDTNAQIAFMDFTQGVDNVQILNNTDWDTGGHNSLRVHYDTGTGTLIKGNLVGPGCLHNCIDTKGINGTVTNNTTTCPQSSKRGQQCVIGSNSDAGFYTENTFVLAGTSPTYIGNVAYDTPLGFQVEQTSGHAITPKFYNNTVYGTAGASYGMYIPHSTAPDIRKNILSGNILLPGSGVTWDYNDKFVTSGAPSGTHDIVINPAYVNPNNADFRPTNTTVLTGAGGSGVTAFPYFGALAGN